MSAFAASSCHSLMLCRVAGSPLPNCGIDQTPNMLMPRSCSASVSRYRPSVHHRALYVLLGLVVVIGIIDASYRLVCAFHYAAMSWLAEIRIIQAGKCLRSPAKQKLVEYARRSKTQNVGPRPKHEGLIKISARGACYRRMTQRRA
jgi:hypothetical protein